MAKNFLVTDFEFTVYTKPVGKPRGFFSEILEIGATKLNGETFERVGDIQSFVKPQFYVKQAEESLNFSMITMADLKKGILFPEMIERMKEQYADEVKERWGNTKAYEESVQKTENRSEDEEAGYAEGMKLLLKEFSKHLNEDPGCEEVQELVYKWQQFITKNYYECTNEILSGLGQMYVADERFLEFMDQYGKGTAQLVCDGIGIYCKKGR